MPSERIDTPRPLTHELVTDILDSHDVSIAAVRITVRRGRVFFAEIDTTGPRGRCVLPCRPSDAIALALRQRLPTPILVAEWVFSGADADSAEPEIECDTETRAAETQSTRRLGRPETSLDGLRHQALRGGLVGHDGAFAFVGDAHQERDEHVVGHERRPAVGHEGQRDAGEREAAGRCRP